MISAPQKSMTKVQIEIIKTVLYFDVFKYPLTREELFQNSAVNSPESGFNEELESLLQHGLIQELEGFILGKDRGKEEINNRLLGNEGAKKIMPTAYEYSRKISSFPFVESVCLSGALSKNYYDKNGDIDFFIITKPGRLWLCRTFLILRYKLLSKHKKKFWCVNYFISSDNLKIPDVNDFTATELSFLIPTVNYGLYRKLLEKNAWYKTRFPNKTIPSAEFCIDTPQPFFKVLIEKILSGKFGHFMDNLLLSVTLNHWQKKYPELSKEEFELQYRSKKNVCKRHTKGFQNKILVFWLEKQKQFEEYFNLSLL